MLHEEVEKYINLTGDKEAWENTSVSRIGGYLDGYEKGLEVLDKIRAEVENGTHHFLDGEPIIEIKEVLQIIDKYKAEGSKEA